MEGLVPPRSRWHPVVVAVLAMASLFAAARPARAEPPGPDVERAVREVEEDQDAQILQSSAKAVVSRL